MKRLVSNRIGERHVSVQAGAELGGVWVAADPNKDPVFGAWLNPDEARKVARWLLKAADKAERE